MDVFEAAEIKRTAPAKKSAAVAITLCCLGFVGLAGLHRLYLGRVGTGILMVCTLGGIWIWTLIDLHRLWENELPDARGIPLREGYSR